MGSQMRRGADQKSEQPRTPRERDRVARRVLHPRSASGRTGSALARAAPPLFSHARCAQGQERAADRDEAKIARRTAAQLDETCEKLCALVRTRPGESIVALAAEVGEPP